MLPITKSQAHALTLTVLLYSITKSAKSDFHREEKKFISSSISFCTACCRVHCHWGRGFLKLKNYWRYDLAHIDIIKHSQQIECQALIFDFIEMRVLEFKKTHFFDRRACIKSQKCFQLVNMIIVLRALFYSVQSFSIEWNSVFFEVTGKNVRYGRKINRHSRDLRQLLNVTQWRISFVLHSTSK